MTLTNENIDNFHKIIVEIEDYAILRLDENGTVLDWNKGAEKLKGYLSNEIIGKNFRLFYTKEDCERALPEKLIANAILSGKANDEGWRVKKDGSLFWGNILITATYDEKKKLTGFLKITRDLTERKSIEEKQKQLNNDLESQLNERTEKLLKNEKQFRHTLDNMLEGIQIHDFNWRYIYVNNALVKSSTYSREELMGNTLMEKYPGIEQTDLFKKFEHCMNERISEQLETEFTFPDGSTSFFKLSVQPINEGLFILSVDISERKKAELKLLKVNRLYNFISNVNKSIVHIKHKKELLDKVCDIATKIGQFKMAWIGLLNEDNILEIASFSGDEIEAKKILRSSIDPNDFMLKDIPVVKVLRSGQYSYINDIQNDPSLEHLIEWKKEFSRQGIYSSISLPIFRSGKTTGVFGLHSGIKDFFDQEEISLLEEAAGDISFALENYEKTQKHNETEELLGKNEKRFRSLIEKSTDMKTLTSKNGNFIYASPSITNVFGYSEEDFLKKSVFNFFHTEDIPDLMKQRDDIMKTPGKSFNFQYRLLHKDDRWIWCEGTLTNMLHEPAINALVSNFRDISEKKMIELQQEFDRNNLHALINNTNDFLWSVDKDFKLISCNQPFYESIKLASGKEIIKGDDMLSFLLSAEQLERFKTFYERSFKGEEFTEEYYDLLSETWLEISFNPIRNGEEITGTACHSHDITVRKKTEYEREKMIDEIIMRNKNFEQFAYIVSHNLRAPVANILGISNVLKGNISESERTQTQQFLFKAIEHLDEIVKDLNGILSARNEISENKETVYFSELIKGIESSVQNLIQKQQVKLLTDFSKVDTLVTLKSYIYSIFYNLIINSIKYKHNAIDPVIEIKSDFRNGKIVLSFKDNGRGIDLKQHGEKVFGLYKRFHLDVSGKGLGLFMVRTQVEVLGGSIHVKSTPGLGSEFIIELPVSL